MKIRLSNSRRRLRISIFKNHIKKIMKRMKIHWDILKAEVVITITRDIMKKIIRRVILMTVTWMKTRRTEGSGSEKEK